MLTRTQSAVRPELLIVLLLFVATALVHQLGMDASVVLQVYFVPVLLAGYRYGRMRALATAAASVGVAVLLLVLLPQALLGESPAARHWLDLTIWTVLLTGTAGITGHLYESKQRALDDLRDAYNGVLEIVSMFIDTADRYTEAHSVRVSIYSVAIAKRLGLSGENLENIRVASLLHDVGKLEVSIDVLRKVGQLSEEEWKIIRQHPADGARIVDRVGGKLRSAVPLILYHHERYDGDGYYKLRADEIPLGARIIAVADAFDAMTTNRSYRAALAPEKALAILASGAGTQFDAAVVEVFLAAMADRSSGLAQVRDRGGSLEPERLEPHLRVANG